MHYELQLLSQNLTPHHLYFFALALLPKAIELPPLAVAWLPAATDFSPLAVA